MHTLVKQLVNDDGDIIEKNDQCWHLMQTLSGDAALLCTGEFVDDAAMSSNGATYVFKDVKRGGITCKKCTETLMQFKSIKL